MQQLFIGETTQVRFEFEKKSFHHQEVKIFNELPTKFIPVNSRLLLNKILNIEVEIL